MDEEQQKKIRSRRSHRKSRLGCGNCKKRRVKCDEKKPICSNCLHHSIDCDFSTRPSQCDSQPRCIFRQSKYQPLTSQQTSRSSSVSNTTTTQSVAAQSVAVQSVAVQSVAIQCDLPPIPYTALNGITFADLHLFHHFVTNTSRTLADQTNDPTNLWQIHLPQWAISFRSILHLILALSALHLGSLSPAQSATYTQQADEHFTFGVQSVTDVLRLDQLDSSNCQSIYMAAVLICLTYFARGPRPGEYLVFHARGKSEWLVLLHGVRAILASKHDEIFTGVLEPAPPRTHGADKALTPLLHNELAKHQLRIRELRAMVEMRVVDDEDEKGLYLRAVDDLLVELEKAYERRNLGCHPSELMPFAMGWTFRLPDRLIQRLEERESVALIVLAHWTVLLRLLDGLWFMRGWARHLIHGIRGCLCPEDHAWIEWPYEVITTNKT